MRGDNKPPPVRLVTHTQQPLTEQLVMRMFVDQNKDKLRYNHDTKMWLVWREHRWREDRTQKVFSNLMEFCRSIGTTASVQKIRYARAIEEGARAEPEIATEQGDWDADPWLLGTPGGMVDLQSGNLRPGLPADMISKIVARVPAERANCPRWKAFLNEALGGKADNIAFFQRFCGYSLTGLTTEESLLFIVGKPGTGKGTASKTILSLMRDYARPMPIAMFTDGAWRALEYYRAKLPRRRMILASEPEKGSTWSDAFVNELTGGDMLTGRNPAGRPFDFDPEFKLWLQGEQVPQLRSVGTGLKRRLRILVFAVEPQNPDPNLKQALKAEWPGILRWMIDGCLEWQRIGLAPPPDVQNAVDDYFTLQDSMGRWIEECCETLPQARSKPSELRNSFNGWADRNGERRLSFSDFHEAITKKFRQTTVHGTHFVNGVFLKPEQSRSREAYEPDREY